MVVTGGAPATVAVEPVVVLIVTLLVTSIADSVAPEISPPSGAMMKSRGSMVNVPVFPAKATVVTNAPLATLTLAPEASIAPPLPLIGALASSVPPTVTTPVAISASRLITPPRFCRVRAWITPVLLTAE